mmetsp:Transcript_49159/g.123574  ORF Transcript_49159/g.123574 Transcript_49159/m.123574 type:complete len:372 (-) Transcript_49159:2024-3139(-)
MGIRREGDRSIARVIAGHVALATVDAQLVVHHGYLLLLVVQLVVGTDAAESTTQLVLDTRDGGRIHRNHLRFLGLSEQIRILDRLLTQNTTLQFVLAEAWQSIGLAELDATSSHQLLERGALVVPIGKVLARLQIEIGLEAGHVVLDDREILVLNRRADLHQRRASVQELYVHIGTVATTSGHHRKAGQRFADSTHRLQCHRTHCITANTTIGGALLLADVRPRGTITTQAHQAAHRVDSSYTAGSSFVGSLGNHANIGHVRCQLGEERNAWLHATVLIATQSASHPLADVEYHLRILATSQTHATLTHAMRTGEVQFQCLSTASLCLLRQFHPIFLAKGAHDGSNDDIVRKVGAQLSNGGAPVLGGLLGD